MNPYNHIRLTTDPDRADIASQGRPSRYGKLKSKTRRTARRILAKRNRAIAKREVNC